ncbi:uncharacterized protein LOC134211098 [Armigeres subalbatus]|uniref:uncharacterized protein LOC134211098 n=1 Tax=Armigeres subalbatus TaxID=124917 RepID=UPI002ED1C7AE
MFSRSEQALSNGRVEVFGVTPIEYKEMRALLMLVALALLFGGQLVLCARNCQSLQYSLDDIHDLLDAESKQHNYDMYRYGGESYVSRTRYILEKLNADIRKTQQSNAHNGYYNPNKYYNSAQPASGCKKLEDEILAKSKEFGIQKIGLEDNLTRLRKVLQYQDDKNSFYLRENEECKKREQDCEEDKTELGIKLNSSESNHAQMEKKIKKLNDTINKLEVEKKILQTKLNANAPAIHGETGIEYPNIQPGISKTTSTTTTESIATVEDTTTVTSTEDDNRLNQATDIPDIDLRNSASDANVQQ